MVRLILLATLALSGCAPGPLAPDTFTKETTIAVGKSVQVADGVSVMFVGVTGDSRCPADAICIQGGDAVVALQLTISGSTRSVELHEAATGPVTSGDITITLLQLDPYPFSSHKIQPEEYRATIRVKR